MLKKYSEFIKEADETNELSEITTAEKSDTDESSSSQFVELKDELKTMIEKSAEKSKKEYGIFVSEFLKNPKDIKIEGLIKDAEIFEFYQKWGNDIDEILNKVKFFDERPSELNAIGLYKYLIIGTEKAVIEVLKMK